MAGYGSGNMTTSTEAIINLSYVPMGKRTLGWVGGSFLDHFK